MIKFIDNILNKVTMYRLLLYVLAGLLIIAEIFSFFKILPFTPQALLFSTVILLFVSWITNNLFTQVFKTHTNVESVYITALILALLITPPLATEYISIIPFLVWASILGIASKFILAIFKKHIFNPAAFGIVLTAFAINQSATWWVGTISMIPFVLIGGLLITRKIRRFDLVLSFLITAIISIVAVSFWNNGIASVPITLKHILIQSPIFFFATVMLTEPLTTPPTKKLRMAYAILTGVLFSPTMHFGGIYSTPELALCAGNIFSWLVSPKFKYILTLKSKNKIANNTGEFIFSTDRAISFRPGQYLEWTLDHNKPDSRGNRRYFTIASSPTEKDLHLGIKFSAPHSSTFKTALAGLDEGKTIMAGQLAGDFILPKDKNKKLCFIAGGIGITPFISMINYMLDKDEHRDIVLLYSSRTFKELAYTDTIHEAHEKLGLKAASTLSDTEHIPTDWKGYKGYIDTEMIIREAPDYMDRIFYISGPNSLVTACEKVLKNLNVPQKQIVTDYFPGF